MALPLRADARWMPACAGMTIVERDWNERTVARGTGRIGNCWRGRGEADRGEPHAGGAAGGAPDPGRRGFRAGPEPRRSEEHTSELQSLMRLSSAVFCLQKKKTTKKQNRERK